MAGKELASDAAVEHSQTQKVSDTAPLVSTDDMKNFPITRANEPAIFDKDGDKPETLDFDKHPLAKIDQCAPDYENIGTDRNPMYWPTEKGDLMNQAAEQVLNGPERPVKGDLSPEDRKSADDVAAHVEKFFNSSEQARGGDTNAGNFLEKLDGMSDAREKLGESLSSMPNEKMDDVLAAANEKLKSQGMRIERLPDTDEVWMKQTKPGQPEGAVFAKKASCPTS